VEGRRRAEAAIADGSAAEMYARWVRAQGGDPDEAALERAPVVRHVEATADGHVASLRALPVGIAALRLGAGRSRKGDEIDDAVGVVCLKKRGDTVERGEPLAEVHARAADAADKAVREVADAYAIADERPEPRPIVLETVA
jgi:thymidine phosphorylase